MHGFRKNVTLEMVGGKGKRQRLWEEIQRRKGKTWSRNDLCDKTGINEGTADTYLACLLAGGIIEVDHVDAPTYRGVAKGKVHYKMVRDVGAEAPRLNKKGEPVTQGLAQEQMWRTLRMLKTDINARELAAHASTEAVPVAHTAASDYLRTLDAAGYLDCTREQRHNPKMRGGSQAMRYRLKVARNTGPRPPMICRTRAVFDPNENRIVWQPEVTEEDAIYG